MVNKTRYFLIFMIIVSSLLSLYLTTSVDWDLYNSYPVVGKLLMWGFIFHQPILFTMFLYVENAIIKVHRLETEAKIKEK